MCIVEYKDLESREKALLSMTVEQVKSLGKLNYTFEELIEQDIKEDKIVTDIDAIVFFYKLGYEPVKSNAKLVLQTICQKSRLMTEVKDLTLRYELH